MLGGEGGEQCVSEGEYVVHLWQSTLLCLAESVDVNRWFCSVCRSLSHFFPMQMSRPLQVKPAGTDARSGTTQMRCREDRASLNQKSYYLVVSLTQ